jgi:hypothetical protein
MLYSTPGSDKVVTRNLMPYFAYFAAYISNDQEWFSPTQEPFTTLDPRHLEKWLETSFDQAIKYKASSGGVRKYWVLCPCHEKKDRKHILNEFDRCREELQDFVNEVLQSRAESVRNRVYEGADGSDDEASRKLVTIKKTHFVSPFTARLNGKLKGLLPAPAKEFWLCGLYGLEE